MEMIQKEMPTPSCGCKKASTGLSTGFVVDIGAPIAAEDLKSYTVLYDKGPVFELVEALTKKT
jgi:hypothetical protein